MQKKVIALAVAGLVSGAAFAQSNVTIYGVADVGVEVGKYGDNAGVVTRAQSGQQAGSRLGFKGEEALGNGLKALFTLEMGISMDTGNHSHAGAGVSATTSSAFSRQAFAGLSSDKFGTVTIGRQYTAFFNTLVKADAFGYGLGAQLGNTLAKLPGATSRTDNTIIYATPNFSGFSGALAYGSGGAAGAETPNQAALTNQVNKVGRYVSAQAAYENGPVYAGLAYSELTGGTPANLATNGYTNKTWVAAGSYDFKVVKVLASYAAGKLDQDNGGTIYKGDGWSLGAKVPLGTAHVISAQYSKLNDKMSTDQDFKVWGVGYEYYLSKRTNLYAAYAKGSNNNGATYALDGAAVGNSAVVGSSTTYNTMGGVAGGSQAGYNPWNVMTGVRHTF